MSNAVNVDPQVQEHVDSHDTPAPTADESQDTPVAHDTGAPTVQAAAMPTAPQGQMINLKVLSPAFDMSEGFNVGSVAVDMTVGALKQKICDLVHTHPPPNHQRLIYCGHVLANDTDTLAKVFGPSNIQHQSDFTIHLVVRPQLHGPSATNTPNPASRAHTPVAPSLSNSSSLAPPSANPTPTQTTNNPASNPTTNNAAPAPPPPRRVGPSPPFPHMPRVPGMPPTGQMPPMGMGLPGFIPPHFPGMQPAGANPATPGQIHQNPQNQGIPGIPGIPGLPGIPGTGTTTTRTVNGPNGTQYTVRVTNSTVALHPQQHMPGQQHMFPHHQMLPPQHMHPQHPSPFAPAPFTHMSPTPQNTTTSRPAPGDININDAFDDPVTANDVRELAELTSQFAQLMQAESGISEQARAAAQTLRTNTDTIATRLRASAGRQAARNAQSNTSARGPAQQNSHPATVPSPSPSAQAQQQSTHMQQFDATAATVYLLSSPGGPQALLFAPQGTYTGQPQHIYNMNPMAQLPHGYGPMPGMQFPHSVHLTNGQPQDVTQQQQPAAAGVVGLPHQPLDPAHPNEAVLQIAGQQVVQELVRDHNVVERPNQPVDLLQQWQPLLAQFWLLFRVILFAYFFFPTNQGWYRPLAMALISVVFYFVNGDGAGRRIRDAVRGWWEGVIGIPARQEGQQQQQGQTQPAQAQAPLPDGAQPRTQAAAPQVAQPPPPQQQELHWLRQTLRPAERALALFLASLWPGIGERAGAARREEEERQRRAEQERIAQEEAQRREADEAATAAIADRTEAGRADVAPSTEAAPSQEQDIVSTATVATGADVASGADDVLRARKPVSPRAATVEEEDGKEIDSAATTNTPSTTE